MAETLTVNSPRYDFNTPITADVALVSLSGLLWGNGPVRGLRGRHSARIR